MEQCKWEDVETGVRSMLILYLDNSDRGCAEGIWTLLESQGLTSYKSEIGRHIILIRLLAAVEFVNDCTSLIHEESYELEQTQWAYELEINNFRIAQLAGDEFEITDEYEESALLDMALYQLMGEQRSVIIKAIKSVHTDEMAIMKFLGNFYEKASDDEQDYDYLVKVYGEPKTPTNVYEFYTWIDEGMERRN